MPRDINSEREKRTLGRTATLADRRARVLVAVLLARAGRQPLAREPRQLATVVPRAGVARRVGAGTVRPRLVRHCPNVARIVRVGPDPVVCAAVACPSEIAEGPDTAGYSVRGSRQAGKRRGSPRPEALRGRHTWQRCAHFQVASREAVYRARSVCERGNRAA